MRNLSSTQLYALVVGIAVIAIIAFLIVNGTFEFGDDDENGDDALAQTTEQTEPEEREDGGEQAQSDAEKGDAATPAAGLQPMDSAFQFGDLRLIVTDIRIADRVGQEGDETLALERFARLRFSARNTGLDAFTLDGSLVLIDAVGRRYTPNATATENAARIDADRGNALTQDLQPGITTDLVVVFDVPEEVGDFRLRITGGYVEVELDR